MKGLGGLVVLASVLAWAYSNPSGLSPASPEMIMTQQAAVGSMALPTKLPQARPRADRGEPVPEPRPEGTPSVGWRSLRFAGASSPSLRWPGYLCTDIDEKADRRSLWYREDDPDATAQIYPGSCAEWANQTEEEVGG